MYAYNEWNNYNNRPFTCKVTKSSGDRFKISVKSHVSGVLFSNIMEFIFASLLKVHKCSYSNMRGNQFPKTHVAL